ncbi:alpha-tocopherol transfer protein-like [Culicoides brevitarsis]|uniref:alpha-tocopherol transfer protein-like n=1 Tax=Culicoides brevitarsis TaxID=469753 RepID=UPI00307C91F5
MVNIRPISKELALKAEKELNEKPERIQEDIDALRAWIAKTPYLRARTDDQFLVNILRGCKYSLEKAKTKIDAYYTIRTAFSEVFSDRYPITDKMIEILRLGIILPLPETDGPDGPRIVLSRVGMYDPEKYTLPELFKSTLLITDVLHLTDDNVTIAGQTSIQDSKGVTMAHLSKFNPLFMKKMSMAFQEGNPTRIKGLHYVNTPPAFLSLFNFFKTFLNDKVKSRIRMYGDNMEELHKNIPKRLLPAEYGGEAGTIAEITEHWVQKVLEHAEYFKEDAKYGTDEKKRPGRPKNAENLFGIEGSFRQLSFD